MAFFRILFGAMLLAAIGCFALSIVTRNLRWRRRGVRLLIATAVLALGVFGLIFIGSLGGAPTGR